MEVYLEIAIDGLKMPGVFCYFEIKCFSGYSIIYVFKIRKLQIIAIIAHREISRGEELLSDALANRTCTIYPSLSTHLYIYLSIHLYRFNI